MPVNKRTALMVMLTHNDRTVPNAHALFDQCKHTQATLWGLKEKGLPLAQMKNLYAFMKQCGKTTVLEVVAYTEDACLAGAHMAVACGCDILIGTVFFDKVNAFCQRHRLKYMPFVGNVSGRPSVLEGDAQTMVREAETYLQKGVYGINLLGYRYAGNPLALCQRVLPRVNAPVCLAGGIDSYAKLDEVRALAPWAVTIGGAFFEARFGTTHPSQIDAVCAYIQG